MSCYTTYGEFQAQMKAYYLRTGNRMQFPEMAAYLSQNGLLRSEKPVFQLINDYDSMTDEEFNRLVDSFPLFLPSYIGTPLKLTIQENELIPNAQDVFVIRHPCYTRPYSHRHNYFEVNFVADGQGKFIFKKEERVMHEGELCIIAPNSEHDILIEDDSTIFTICIRKSTFDTTFFSLMSRKDLLSYFFRTILRGDNQDNYLLFFTKENQTLKKYIRHMMIESNHQDIYSNACSISYVNLMFSTLLRNYSQTIQFYNYEMGSDFSLVLQYIQHNYQTLTLSSLAELFHYSEPHLCTMIRQNTGYTFSELIKRLRLADAVDYLIHTNLKVGEIAEQIGYHSADHFSRVFRNTYRISPQEYRKQNKDADQLFVPFSTN